MAGGVAVRASESNKWSTVCNANGRPQKKTETFLQFVLNHVVVGGGGDGGYGGFFQLSKNGVIVAGDAGVSLGFLLLPHITVTIADAVWLVA